jgi:hypothetical protein
LGSSSLSSSAFSPPRVPVSKTKWIAVGVLLLLVLGIVLWSCGKGAYHDYRMSSAAVDLFHRRLDRGDFETIYAEASETFRAAGVREDQIKFLQTVHQKMGNSGTNTVQGFHLNWRNDQLLVDQVYDTKFAQGSAREDFVWLIENDRPLLYGYRVSSSGDELH